MLDHTQLLQLKRCQKNEKCIHPLGPVLPATLDYFYKTPSGLNSICKECKKAYARLWGKTPKGKASKQVSNRSPKSRARDKLHSQTLERKASQKNYRQSQKGKEAKRIYSQTPKRKSYAKNYKRSPKYKATQNEWRKTPNGKASGDVRRTRYRARKRSLPAMFDTKDWLKSVEYFHGCCAVCGRQARDLFGTHTLAQDHWIPLAKGGGTVPTNIVPLCHGVDGCNNSKRDRDAHQWLISRPGATSRKVAAIEKRIYDYFAWVVL